MFRHLLYSKGTDDSIGTYVTNYLATAECLVFIALVFAFRAHRISQLLHIGFVFIFFCIFFGVSFLFAGLVHHLYPHTEEFPGYPIEYSIFWRISTCTIGFAASMLLITGLSLISFKSQKQIIWIILIVIAVILGLANMGYQIWKPSLTIAGGFFAFSALVAGIMAIVHLVIYKGSKVPGILILIGMLTLIAGAVFQLALGPSCGKVNAHSQGCFLPDDFNHNAVFHIIEMMGLLLYGIGCIILGRHDNADKNMIV